MDLADELGQETSKAIRRYVTTACGPCREHKVKCDAIQPRCSQCLKKNRVCVYHEKGDKRKVSLRSVIELLTTRVNDLTRIIVHNGLQVPAMSAEDHSSLGRALRILELPLLSTYDMEGPSSRPVSAPADCTHSSMEATRDLSAHSLVDFIDTDLDTRFVNNNQETLEMVNVEMDTQFQMSEIDVEMFVNGWPSISSVPETESPEWPWGVLDPTAAVNMATSGGLDRLDMHYMSGERMQSLPLTIPFPRSSKMALQGSEDETDSVLLTQLSTRFGSLQIAPDGRLRFFGAASNIHLLDDQMRSQGSADVRSVHEEGQRLLEHANVHKEIDTEFQNHLLNLYFKWHEPYLPLVDRATFETSRHYFESGGESMGYCSGVLVNAMCAIGAAYEAKYHPTFITFPKPLAEFFAERAKVLLDIELDSPCVATAQGLILLSNHEASVNKDARGWVYSGMAMRLVFDLGLHVDCTTYVEQGKMSLVEAEARRTAFWGSFVVNHLYSFYLGRPFQVDPKEITVARPINKPVRNQDDFLISSKQVSIRNIHQSSSMAEHLVFLCELVTPQAHVLYMYGQSVIDKDDLRDLSEVTTSQLFTWKSSLPNDLEVDLDDSGRAYPPPLLGLHLLYHYLQIMLHRPYTSRSLQPSIPKGPGHTHARTVCLESASSISRLLQLYETHHTFRHMNAHVVHIIFSAALIMIFAMVTGSRSGKSEPGADGWEGEPVTIAAHLSVCFRALDEMSRMYERAKNIRENLSAIQNRWNQMMRKYKNAKRAQQLQSDDSKKRRLNSGTERPSTHLGGSFAQGLLG